MHQRTTLLAWEDRRVELLGVVLLGQDHAGAWATEGLVHGGGHYIRVWHWIRIQIRCNQTSEVSHIGPQVSANFIGDGTECFKIQGARICRPTRDDHLWLFSDCLLAQTVHIQTAGLFIHRISSYFVQLAGEIQLHAVGQVSTMIQRKAQNLIAWVDK